MKRIAYFVLILILVVTTITPCYAKKHHKQTRVRYEDGVVLSYDYYSHELRLLTNDGNIWMVKTTEPLFDNVTVKFDTQGTKRATDDRIIYIKNL